MSNLGRECLVLSDDEIALVIDALDSHEYWQLSDPTWRHSGAVILPSDDPDRWAYRPEPTLDDLAAITEIQRCRSLADRVRRVPS
jgi:hypothetical protein